MFTSGKGIKDWYVSETQINQSLVLLSTLFFFSTNVLFFLFIVKRYGLLVVIISRKRREKVSAWFAAIKSFLGVIVRKRLDSRFITTFVFKH